MTEDESDRRPDTFELSKPEGKLQARQAVDLATEPLFVALLRGAVNRLWPDDPVMAGFVEHVSGPLSDHLGHVGAKGGEFVVQRQVQGKAVDERYTRDQSQRAHLINGLFPVLHVARTLQAWGAPQLRVYDDRVRRVFIAGYVLHDFLKLPGVERELQDAGFSHDRAAGPAQMPLLEAIFSRWCAALGLDRFLEPLGGPAAVLHDLIYVACNTQTRWGTLRVLRLLPRLALVPTQLDLAERLSHLADLLAYVARTPQAVATNATIQSAVAELSNRTARLMYHHIADNRGLLTNLIHNAALAAMGHEYRVPLLYAPSGVIYLECRQAAPPLPEVDQVARDAIERIRAIASRALSQSHTGMRRDGKGMKYASYYWLFFDLPTFIPLGARATLTVIHEKKEASAGKRFAKMRDQGWLPVGADLDLPDDVRVDQLAEWCYLAEKQVAERLPDFDVVGFLLDEFKLDDVKADFLAVPRDNQAGGVGYHWYFAAGHFLKRHGGLDPAAWHEKVEDLAGRLSWAVQAASPPPSAAKGRNDWDDLEDYIRRVLTLGQPSAVKSGHQAFAAELARYSRAKRRGQGRAAACALCSSPYRVGKQQEAAVLFAPQVYSNKRPLHGSDALRDICSVCAMEIMLRQILMNRSAASGGDFEGRRMRYLYFYPTYFFTPETLDVLRRAYVALRRPSFTEMRHQLVAKDGQVNLSPEIVQRLAPLMLTPENEQSVAEDRYLRFHFPSTEPVTFYFMGVPPPGREAKDAEAWVHPAFLALALPLCLDVKVVASESSMPLMLEADELDETVFLDAPHAAIGYLTEGQTRVNVDKVLPTLQRLAVGYLIHVDANSQMGRAGFDYRWQDLPAVARALGESALYTFHYLKKWQRRQQLDSVPAWKVRQYLEYVHYLKGEKEMSHAQQLTCLYRQFYCARRYNSNSILRPITVAARTILDADPCLFSEPDGLVEAVYGAVRSFAERAWREGLAFPPKGSNRPGMEVAMRAFAAYFVNDIFIGAFHGDRSALRGKQLNLLKNACEVIYLDESARDRAERESVDLAENETTEDQKKEREQ